MSYRRIVWFMVPLGLLVAAALALLAPYGRAARAADGNAASNLDAGQQALFEELKPIKLANCELARFGETHDGGYLMCRNLLDAVAAGYSYGISGYDGWGCDISRSLRVPVHQYDCFNLTRPICNGGTTIFHGECIGTAAKIEEQRPFDTLASQTAKNGDAGKPLVVKMDVEGAEWKSLLEAPDDVLRQIVQLQIELHGFDQPHYLDTVRRLKKFFYVAHLHWNNYACTPGKPPFPAWAYEVLFVNKRVGVPAADSRVRLPHVLDAPNNPNAADCQR
jgi:hypothetical protein